MLRRLTLAALALGGFTVVATPALAQSADRSEDPVVILTGRLTVLQNETVSEAVIVDGDAAIDGRVTGSVVAFNGDVLVNGTVGGSVVAMTGRVTLGPGARVGEDVVSRLRPAIDPGATVGGSVRRPDWSGDWRDLRLFGRLAIWVASTVSSFLLGLVLVLFAPRAADTVARAGIERIGPSFGWGTLVFFAIPLGATIAIVTIVGLPFGLGVLLALALLYWIGYTAAAVVLGRRVGGTARSRLLAFTIGWAILRAIALIPIVAGIAWFAATIWGLGALILAARPQRPHVPAVGATVRRPGEAIPPPPPMPPQG